MIRKIILPFLLLLISLPAFGRTYTPAEVPNVQLADSNAYVADPEGILSAESRENLNEMARRIRRVASAEAYVAVIGSTGSMDIDQFATELFGTLGLGKSDKDNGLLLVIARDDRRAAIRTGYGLEGVLPDVVCSRILRNEAFPAFKNGDYDLGAVRAVSSLTDILTDPDNIAEIHSNQADNRPGRAADDDEDFFSIYLTFALGLTAIMLIILGIMLFSVRGKSDFEKYTRLERLRTIYLALSFLGIGIPLLASLPLVIILRHWRDHKRKCPNCGQQMVKIDEVHDNDFLTPSQDAEERVKSVDYDVWRCPGCNYMEILPYVNKSAPFTECESCGARTSRYSGNEIMRQPTTLREGLGVRRYTCLHCGHVQNRYYNIAKLVPVVVVGGGGGRGFGGGGGFSGGGFGGGMTGGGGASGGW